MNSEKQTPLICLLMSTYNGEKFLAEQLQSIENQTHSHWKLIISDDGSSDNTIAIAEQFQQKWGNDRLTIRRGPQQGFCQNFLSMACDANIRADYYAFSDQDDVWKADKLERAIAYFDKNSGSLAPRVYCGRTEIVDMHLNHVGFSPTFALPRSFRNAIVQSIAGGNTMVFNQSTKALLEKTGQLKVVSHDWWLYQIVSGAGGIVFYDVEPSLLYRQHENSLVGANTSFRAKIDRIGYVLNGRFKEWNNINYEALKSIEGLLTQDNQDILNTFNLFRNAKLKDRVRLLEVCGIYRQTKQGTLSLWLATIINKV